jgi:hypothetical protein
MREGVEVFLDGNKFGRSGGGWFGGGFAAHEKWMDSLGGKRASRVERNGGAGQRGVCPDEVRPDPEFLG